ncbi:uncharacterized protein LOC120279376 [Dioscorea cayenensis subsp. rotundata]|uniref:Uncharacterized protein LOC120279376 n=1 Tax=Dioscorea cayennensis subsp. rotundata TaxID=55577 RepID=A0AB40CSY9_DIOCR|nr:uncharacterized protein LOC120279376 [Dioscorea cayenensis subsp. rotundata]
MAAKSSSSNNNNNRRKATSLCENSSKIAMNIVRVSSLCIASLTLGIIGDRASARTRTARSPTAAATSLMSLDEALISKRSVEPEINPRSAYIMEPPAMTAAEGEDGDGVDWRAEDYIKRFRERNKSNANVRAEISRCIPPPPSRVFSSLASKP